MLTTRKILIIGILGFAVITPVFAQARLPYGASSRLTASLPFTLPVRNEFSTDPYVMPVYHGPSRNRLSGLDDGEIVALSTLGGVALITAWGLWRWDYFSRDPWSDPEGWFGNGTYSGGADKVGHTYSGYVISHIFSMLYEYNGMSRDDAAGYGALSSFIVLGYMEFGDSVTQFGFSYEDMIANTVGCLAGYVLYKYPDLGDIVDLRVEIGLNSTKADALTDYDNSRYLLAVKLDGFEPLRDSFLKYFELHVGYYTRGFEDSEPDRERNLFVGVGLNLTSFFKNRGYKRTGTVLKYWQLPYTSATYSHNFN